MTEKQAYDLYAATTKNPVPYGALCQSYQRNGCWWLRGYNCGTVAAVNMTTGEVD